MHLPAPQTSEPQLPLMHAWLPQSRSTALPKAAPPKHPAASATRGSTDTASTAGIAGRSPSETTAAFSAMHPDLCARGPHDLTQNADARRSRMADDDLWNH